MIDLDISQLDAQRQLMELERYDCEQSLYNFLRVAWPYIDSAEWVDSWAVAAMCEHLEAVADGDIRRLIINVPPRHAKSSLVSVAFNAWTWAQPAKGATSGPGVQFLSASYANQLALRDSVKTRRLIESPFYQKMWSDRFSLTSDQNTKSRFSNSKGGERLITSVGAAVTGEGGDCLIGSTLIATPCGDVQISDLRAGDVVYGFDISRGKVVKKRVEATRRLPARNLHALHTSSGHSIVCSGNHPVFDTQNGYRPADEMGRGNRVCVLRSAEKQADQDSSASDVQLVFEGIQQVPVRGAQGAHEERERCVLLGGVFVEPSRGEEFDENMPDVREARSLPARGVLRGCVQTGVDAGADAPASSEGVWVLQDVVCGKSHTPEILQRILPEYASLTGDTRAEEPQAPTWRKDALRSVSPEAPRSDRGTGRVGLRGMRVVRSESDTAEWENGGSASRASHRREPEEQCARESDNSVRFLPSDIPYHVEDTVSEIERYRGSEDWMYDIQVEGTNNFFANGILVHNCIIIDDPNSAAEAFSEATIQSTIDWWTGTMSTRLNNQRTGAYVVIQQRLAENDLTGYLLESEPENWTHLCLPMKYEPERSFVTGIGWKDPRTEPGELLSPARFGDEEVKSLERTLGKYGAAGQLQQRPEPAGGGIIKREWWQTWEDRSFPPMDYILASLDTAYTSKTENDPSAMTVWGVFTTDTYAAAGRTIGPDGRPIYFDRPYNETAPKLMLMHAWSEHLEFHDLIKKVETTCKALKVDKLLVENKAAGISLAQEMRRLYGSSDFAVQLSDPKSLDKMARLFSVQHLFEEGIIYAPDKTWADMVITQVGQFPKGKHDDLCDTVSQSIRHLRDIGLLTRSTERADAIERMTVYPGGSKDAPLYPS